MARQNDYKRLLSNALHSLGCLLEASAPAEALAAFSEALQLARSMDDPNLVAWCLEGAAAIFVVRFDTTHAASLLGAASTIRARIGDDRNPTEKAEADTAELRCRHALTAQAFQSAWDQGASLDTNAAADWALHVWEQEIKKVV